MTTLVRGHPVKKPWVGFIFDVDLQIDEQTPLEKTCATTNALLRDRECGAEASEAYSLMVYLVSMDSISIGTTYGSEKRVIRNLT